ncbi:hypothetical protein MTO96_009133 [Rhipicephalus appendiculatus]
MAANERTTEELADGLVETCCGLASPNIRPRQEDPSLRILHPSRHSTNPKRPGETRQHKTFPLLGRINAQSKATPAATSQGAAEKVGTGAEIMKSSPDSIKLMATEKRHVAGSVLAAASRAVLSLFGEAEGRSRASSSGRDRQTGRQTNDSMQTPLAEIA